MSKRADKEWGEMWSREKEMECGVALQTLASCVYEHWRSRINSECQTTSGEWVEGVGLGQIHDIWNLMYHDMKALYVLEQLVNNHYKTRGIEGSEMKVKNIIKMFSFGQSFEIRGAYSGKTYHKSYLSSEKNLQKYLDKEVIDTPIYSDIRIKGSDANHWCTAVIVIWIYDYDMCKQKEDK